jgi:hypothetical protein
MKAMYYALGLLLVFGAVFAAAAALNVNGGVIQAGSDNTLQCDPAVKVLGWGLELDDGLVYSVRIGEIDQVACAQADLFVTLWNTTPAQIGEGGPHPIDSSTEVVQLDSPVDPAAIDKITVYLEGATP